MEDARRAALTGGPGGIQRRHPVENFPDEDWEEVLQVNLSTVFTITRDAGKHMLETRGGVAGHAVPESFNPRGNGKIINVSSLVAFQGGLNVVAYAAAKHGVQGIVSCCAPHVSQADAATDQVVLQRLELKGSQCQCNRPGLHLHRRV